MTRRLVAAVGNRYRGDDGAALAVLERLRPRLPADVEAVACELEPTRLLESLRDAALAVIVDAVSSGAEPGTLHRHDASADPLPAREFRSSTHAFGVGETLELARALGRLPPRVVVLAIEGATFEAGEKLSAPVAAAVGPAAEAVLAELGG